MTDRRAFYDRRAASRPRESARYYHRLLQRYFAFLIPPGARVVEIGCGIGDLLAAVRPSRGVGVDFSPAMIDLARPRHPGLEFHVGDAADFSSPEPFPFTPPLSPTGGEGGRRTGEGESGRLRDHEEVRGEHGSLHEVFDYILLSDLVNDLPDVQAVLTHLHRFTHPHTRLVVNFFNHLWHPILSLAERMGSKAPTLPQNWLSTADMKNLLHLANWELVKMDTRILWPLQTPILAPLLNRWLAPLLRHFCLTVILVARPSLASWRIRNSPGQSLTKSSSAASFPLTLALSPGEREETLPHTETSHTSPSISAQRASPPLPEGEGRGEGEGRIQSEPKRRDYRCTVVIPARNEAGNIEDAVLRTPKLGLGTEIIFIEGHSTDNTWDEIQRVAAKYPDRQIKVLKQQSKGKGGAVREAFAAASGDLLFILDADLTMPPEQLPQFYEVARSGIGEFVNGVRLVYPMEDQAMRFLNMVANKCFGLAFSWLLGQSIKDTLCGTKVLFRADYEAIARNRSYFGDFDPFGDFDLLFGAAKLNLKIVDLPIRYRARAYGETNIRRWRHGWLLCRMVWFAARRLKFID
ncbi:MAG: glycosyltransferase [Verrucomicrobia bacterium]|nr:glycosyltransferase [Verrucomicrobiota bacterium]